MDTPGVLTDNLKDIVSGADVVVIPVRPTPNDIEPFKRTVSIVSKNTKALWLSWSTAGTASACARCSWSGWTRSCGRSTLLRCPSPRQSRGVRKSVVDVDRHSVAAEAIRRVCREVSAIAGLPFEKKRLKKIDAH